MDEGSPLGASDVETYASVWEARPRKFKNVLVEVALFIVMVELAERLSFFGISQSLRNFMTRIRWNSVEASALKATWTSICYMSPLLGAYLADERWGRFRVIVFFGVWYCVGELLVAISAYPSVMENEWAVNPLFVVGLFVGIGVGAGAIKSSVVTLGADQFDPSDAHEVAQRNTYFSYFYLCLNTGAVVSCGYFSNLSVNGSYWIPEKYGYFATYAICTAVMAIAIVFLLIGSPRYVHMKPTEKALSGFVQLALSNARETSRGKVLVTSTACFLVAFVVNIVAAFSVNKSGEPISYAAGICVALSVIGWVYVGMDGSFLNASKMSHGGNVDDARVDGYKRLVRMLPFAALMVIWQCAFAQIDINFQSITQQCDLRLDTSDPDSTQMPAAMLGVLEPIVVVLCIPVLDSIVYPLYTNRVGKAPSQFGKVVAGLILATVGIYWTGVFEVLRRNSGALVGPDGGPILDCGSDQPMNKMHWAGAIPNYVLLALAECLINVTAYDVFYTAVPLSLKSTAQATNLLMVCMGSILTSVFTIAFRGFLPTDNLNDGNLEYMFFAVGSLSAVNVVAFALVMKKMDFGFASSPENSEYALVASDSAVPGQFYGKAPA